YSVAREDDNEVVRCLSLAEGSVLWQEASAAPFEMDPMAQAHGKGPKSTPAVAGGRAFVLGINGRLSAFDAKTGAVLWRKTVAGERVIFGKITRPIFAVNVSGADMTPAWETREITLHMSSPVLSGSTLYGMAAQRSGSLFTIDAASGEMLWRSEGRLGPTASL